MFQSTLLRIVTGIFFLLHSTGAQFIQDWEWRVPPGGNDQ